MNYEPKSLNSLCDERRMSIQAVAKELKLEPAELQLFAFRNYRLHKENELLALVQAAKQQIGRSIGEAIDLVAKKTGLETRTLYRVDDGSSLFKGVQIFLCALHLKKPFSAFANPYEHVVGRKPGRKPTGEALQKVKDSGRLSAFFMPFPLLWDKERSTGIIADQFMHAFSHDNVTLVPEWLRGQVREDAFAKGFGGDVLLTTIKHGTAFENLQRVMPLAKISLAIISPTRLNPQGIANELDATINDNVAVFKDSYTDLELRDWGVPDSRIITVPGPIDALMLSVRDGKVNYAAANRYELDCASRHHGGLSVSNLLTFAFYSLWVRKGEVGLAYWLEQNLKQQQRQNRLRIQRFNKEFEGYFTVLIH